MCVFVDAVAWLERRPFENVCQCPTILLWSSGTGYALEAFCFNWDYSIAIRICLAVI